jgi:tetratricopeptide (TPR) repeat protein
MNFLGWYMSRRFWSLFWSVLLLSILVTRPGDAQLRQTGKIVGSVRVLRADFPVHPVLISLEMRGSAMASVYADDQGRFGFPNLSANEYKITVNDDAYEPVSLTVEVDPATASMNFVQITLIPRSKDKKDPMPARAGGSNPYLVDPADYYRQFPKKTVKEYEKGIDAEHHGKADEAIEHYEKALSYSPEFYPAHNNLGSVYLSRQNFEAAQNHFESALKANQKDAQAYFNLANVMLLTQRFDEAEHEIGEGLQRRPDSAFGYFLQGSLYARTKRAELAEKSLLNALRLDPAMSQGYLQLVNIYLQQKRTEDAISQLEAYLKAFPDTPFSPQARDLLKRLQGNAAPVSQ